MNRSAAGKEAMVVSPHALASQAGAETLRRGGNAFDAAVAVSACLAVVYPHMTGLGGDAFWLTYSGADRAVRAYNASGRSAGLASRQAFAGESGIPLRGIRSAITVPGMADGWEAVQREYGRLSLAEALEPAIRCASYGFPLSPDQARNTAERFELLRGTAITSEIFVPEGVPPRQGERFLQRQLADTLRKLAAGGRDAFYKGEIARSISVFMEKNGGLLRAEDFADHAGEWTEPVRGGYRGLELFQVPPNSQGFTGIMIPQMLESFDLSGIEHGSYEYVHLLVEAAKLAFRDRDRVLTDPAFADIPVGALVSGDYCAELAAGIDLRRASPSASRPVGSDTAYAAVVDGEGNAVSFIQSLYFEFGSGVTAGDTGILLQNRGSFFSLDPQHVNALEPRKRTFHTLMPAMACREGKPYILYGTQGGEGQPQTQSALLTRMVDYGMDPQAAIDAPRWVWGRTWGAKTQELKLEARFGADVAMALASAGHEVRTVGAFDGIVGHAQAILIGDDGTRYGGADPRADGGCAGW